MSEAATVHPPMTTEQHEQGIQAWCRAFLARAEAWRPCDGDIARWMEETLDDRYSTSGEMRPFWKIDGFFLRITVEDKSNRIIFSSRDLGNGTAELHVQDFDHLGGELVPSVCQTLRRYLNPVPNEEPEVSE